MKTTAVILCRYGSSRLRGKHFKKVGEKYAIEHTLNSLTKNKNIDEFYIASGTIKKNLIFKKKLSYLYPRLKFYFHKNENNVVERIANLAKKIKNENLIIISGDCPIIDNQFLYNMFSKFCKKDYDITYSKKKLQHEGILLTKTRIWDYVNKNSKTKKYQEHPGLFIKENYKDFVYMDVPYKSNDQYQNLRMSIDTKSDLDFFNIIHLLCKKNNLEFNFKNFLFFKKYRFINSHVNQKNKNFKIKKDIYLVTSKNHLIGLGHYKRMSVIKREISETMSIIPKVVLIKNIKEINFFKKKFLINNKNKIFVFDLPKKYFKKFCNIKMHYPKIIIDNLKTLKKDVTIIPSINNINKISSSKPNYFTIDRNLLFEYTKWLIYKKKYRYDLAIITGGTYQMNNEVLSVISKLNQRLKLIFLLGPYANDENIKALKRREINYIYNPKNYFKLILNSKNVLSRFGTSIYELMAINKKPIIYFHNDSKSRKKDINNLFKLNYAIKFNKNNLLNSKKNYLFKLKGMSFGAKNVISVINHYYNK